MSLLGTVPLPDPTGLCRSLSPLFPVLSLLLLPVLSPVPSPFSRGPKGRFDMSERVPHDSCLVRGRCFFATGCPTVSVTYRPP